MQWIKVKNNLIEALLLYALEHCTEVEAVLYLFKWEKCSENRFSKTNGLIMINNCDIDNNRDYYMLLGIAADVKILIRYHQCWITAEENMNLSQNITRT